MDILDQKPEKLIEKFKKALHNSISQYNIGEERVDLDKIYSKIANYVIDLGNKADINDAKLLAAVSHTSHSDFERNHSINILRYYFHEKFHAFIERTIWINILNKDKLEKKELDNLELELYEVIIEDCARFYFHYVYKVRKE